MHPDVAVSVLLAGLAKLKKTCLVSSNLNSKQLRFHCVRPSVSVKSAVQKYIIGLFSYLLGQKYIAKKFGSDVVSVFFKVRCVNGKSAVQKHIIGLLSYLMGQNSF